MNHLLVLEPKTVLERYMIISFVKDFVREVSVIS